jgi:homoprotocatechuate degradation regulator HpaR
MSAFQHRNLPRLLLQARETVLLHFRPDLREQGLTDQQWRVLRVLAEHPRCDASTLAQEAYLLGPSLSGVLSRMERDGLILRGLDAQDARRQWIEASKAGKQLVRKLAASIESHYSRVEQHLGREQLGQLYNLLDAVIHMPHEEAIPATQTKTSPAAKAVKAKPRKAA